MPEPIVITVKLATVLARHTDNNKTVACKLSGPNNLTATLNFLDEKYPGIKPLICGTGDVIKDSINVYVNGDNVRYLKGLETDLTHGDIVNIIPAAAAG